MCTELGAHAAVKPLWKYGNDRRDNRHLMLKRFPNVVCVGVRRGHTGFVVDINI